MIAKPTLDIQTIHRLTEVSSLEKDEQNLVWIDTETTGPNHSNNLLLEIAVVVTSPDLKKIKKIGNWIVYYPRQYILDQMNEWCVKTHTESGLVDACASASPITATLEKISTAICEGLDHYIVPGKAVLCGNSVHFDRRVLENHLPEVARLLHYKNIDVSSFKEMFLRWYGDLTIPQKSNRHTATEDIYESIAELRHYKETIRSLDELNDILGRAGRLDILRVMRNNAD